MNNKKYKFICDIKRHILSANLNPYEKAGAVVREIAACRGFDDTLFAEYITEFLELDEWQLIREFNSYLDMIYEFADENGIFTGYGERVYERIQE